MIESWADNEEYGILSENSNSDPSYSSSSNDTDSECSESHLARSGRCPPQFILVL